MKKLILIIIVVALCAIAGNKAINTISDLVAEKNDRIEQIMSIGE